jgi:hypothetical protein
MKRLPVSRSTTVQFPTIRITIWNFELSLKNVFDYHGLEKLAVNTVQHQPNVATVGRRRNMQREFCFVWKHDGRQCQHSGDLSAFQEDHIWSVVVLLFIFLQECWGETSSKMITLPAGQQQPAKGRNTSNLLGQSSWPPPQYFIANAR